ncbi:Peptidase C19, ubiquitin carboxyl-terminal hydrolase [Kalmanozyma brasiliensis GHG001]|uniref:Ubiquitin carboxyl-terminal hydrolase n=1 Tax=Kalmanozyma brasiliensis (strain GHG001) TaxID=1365824 RepID=V5GJK9_KALBG|nr:Peptidase C19, ubiquitin carboxyl-terminal hydrolase [Kalmanozyma brasiliensis GHG001]EST06142.1 Peptidase C19, ubiquitin carboxyl-terminal hydrolase [Kalmanozyma brasiliensis GHG001]
MAEVVRRPSSQADGSSGSGSGSRSFSQSPQKKGLHRSDSFSSPTKKQLSSPNGHHKRSSSSSSLPTSPSKQERKKLAKEILASGGDQLRDTLKQRGMLHALLSDPVQFIKSNQKQGQDYTALGLVPVNDPNFAAAQKRKEEQKQHSLLLHTDSPKVNGANGIEDELPSSPTKNGKAKSRDLYPYKISLRFPGKVHPTATGLANYGNTCYMNSVMQSLIHTPPLAFALLTQDLDALHGEWGGKPSMPFDAVSAMQAFTRASLMGSKPTNAPRDFNRNLKLFAKPLRQGRQEDAHEYLRFLLEALQQSSLSLAPKALKPDDPVRRTTFVQKMFGGKLRSRVTCHNCGHNSDTFDPFMDLSLDVRKGINSLTDAFRAFVAKDHLTGSEKYKCDKCKRKVDATKQFTIESAPPALTVHLKRFTAFGGKVSRQIAFDEGLNIAPYLSVNKGPARYRLYAVVHHYGSGPNSGHYVASVRSPSGKWTRMDDSLVSEMGRSGPTNDQSAYILFYLKEKDELEKAIAATVVPSKSPKQLVEGKKRKAMPESDSDSEAEDSFDDEAAYRAALKRQKSASAATSPIKKPKRTDDDSDSSLPPSKLNGTPSALDQMLSSKPKSTTSFYASPTPRNPFTLPSASSDTDLGTPLPRTEYESLIGTPATPARAVDVEADSDTSFSSPASLSKKERRKQKKAIQSSGSRGIPTSPYASALTGLTNGKEKKKSKREKLLGGLAGRMKPRS